MYTFTLPSELLFKIPAVPSRRVQQERRQAQQQLGMGRMSTFYRGERPAQREEKETSGERRPRQIGPFILTGRTIYGEFIDGAGPVPVTPRVGKRYKPYARPARIVDQDAGGLRTPHNRRTVSGSSTGSTTSNSSAFTLLSMFGSPGGGSDTSVEYEETEKIEHEHGELCVCSACGDALFEMYIDCGQFE